MIALATTDDIVKCADLAEWFFNCCNCPGQFDRSIWCSTWNNLLNAGLGLILKRDNGSGIVEAVGVIVYPSDTDGKLSAASRFWYALDDYKGLEGGMLCLAVQRILKERGIKRLFMTSLINNREGKVSNYLLKDGFSPIEVVYGKELV